MPATSLFYDTISFHAASGKGGTVKLAAFILEHGEEAMFMTIGELATAIGVSAGTISRAARLMGFASFSDLQGQMRQVARGKLTPAAKLKENKGTGLDSNTLLAHDMDDIKSVTQRNPDRQFEEAATLLANAPAVHIMGQRSSHAVAFTLGISLLQIRKHVFIMDQQAGMLTESILRIQPEDLVVLIAFPRYVQATVSMVDEVRNIGCTILGITDGPFSPLAAHAMVAFYAPYESLSYFNSTVGAISIVNTLLIKTAVLLHSHGKERLELYNSLMERWHVLNSTSAQNT